MSSISPARRAVRARARLVTVATAMALLVGLLPGPGSVALGGVPGVTELFISEYVEGSSNNKALEIYNGTGASVDLAAGGYNVQMFFNGSASAGLIIDLTGTVADDDVYVVAQGSAAQQIIDQADQTSSFGFFNGNDAVVLRKGSTILDVIGQVGFNPLTEWGTGLTSTADNTLRREASITAGDPDGSNAFDPAVQWDGFATDTFDGLGSHTVTGPTLDPCTVGFTAISSIQGSGATVAITGTVTTEGVVVGDYEGPSPALRGFYLQDPTGDGDAATSDGIFVFESNNANTVSLGDVVRVTGTAGENQGQSQISSTSIVRCGTDTVAATDVSLPFASATDAERWEGMLVRLPQTLSVTEHFQLGRFGQVVVSSGGRLAQPTNVVAPGAPALALQAANNLNRLIIDDASQAQNPDPILFGRGGLPLSASNTLRGGDTATGIVGVMTWTWAGSSASGNAYRVRPVNALNGFVNFVEANSRPTGIPGAGGSTQFAAMNLLNFFNTFDGLPDTVDNCSLGVGGAPADCRGADTQVEFDRQWPKTVEGIVGSGADVIGINEIENDGYGPSSAIQFLVDRLNAATTPGTYAFIDADAATSQLNALGTDAIKVGMLYKPALLTPVGQTAALNTVAFVNGGDGAPRSRPALAQSFEDNVTGGRVTVVVNHLKSKGSACDAPDAGDGQGNCNVVRTNAATELVNWLATDPTGIGDPDVLILGDLNSYAREDPITAIRNAGYTNLVDAFVGPGAYSYVFDGQWGYLDHALGSASLASQVAGVVEWHINADEPSVLDYNTNFKSAGLQASLYAADRYRISDHDPLIVGLNLAYPFGGFLPPVDGDEVNIVKAGSAVPLTFSLGGDRGLDIFAAGSPASAEVACDGGAPAGAAEPTVTAGWSTLAYDPLTDTYTYAWKTDRAWAGTCRVLLLTLNDGQTYRAEFSFLR
ncbi:MAG TPA: ExeM/NucH family extracellular endonuclease [Candidatus Sulfomarinibacteraceae bacterium]|nr:ExeM/NucH family extracellular endonuclease [Candidatus Sulfomarinibacteraceae bacterium]